MLEAKLNELLSESIASAKRREQETFDRTLNEPGTPIILFGAGRLGRDLAAKLRSLGVVIHAFADNNPALWNTDIDGVRVRRPEDLAASHGSSAVFVVALLRAGGGHRDVYRQAVELGCKRVLPFTQLAWKYPDVFLPYYMVDLPHKLLAQADKVRQAFHLMSDEKSREEYVSQVEFRLTGDFRVLGPPDTSVEYFPSDLFSFRTDEVFVDCGAFDGDTIRTLLDLYQGRFQRIEAFEPDPINFQKLKDYVATLDTAVRARMHLHELATGETACQLKFTTTGTMCSFIGPGETTIECQTLDQVLYSVAPTLIKMDIEGFEPEALRGGRRLIHEHRPVLVVCLYHIQDHLWKLPLLIHSFDSSYTYYIRPYDEAVGLICYAIPKDRLLPAKSA